jgi:erythromycin esterase
MAGDDVVTVLDDHAVPLSATTPASGKDALADDDSPSGAARLADRLADATVAGLGEATHGTRECFRLKRRLIRSLVGHHGFRTVAFEAGVSATLPADEYVRRGTDDGGRWGADTPEAALAELDKWMWQTEAVRELLLWLRSFNEDRPPEDRVRVRGIDLGDPSEPASGLKSYFEAVDPEYAERADELAALADFEVPEADDASDRRLAEAEQIANAVADRLDQRREAYVSASSDDEWRVARRLCRVVEQACEWHRVRHRREGPHAEGMAERDRLMAENALYWAERDPGEGVAVWAHNSHVQRGTFDDGQVWTDATTMGERLDRSLGDSYRALCFDFARGSFRAVSAGGGSGGTGPQVFSVGDPPGDTATAHLDALDAAPCFLDVASAADDPRLEAWFDRPRCLRWVGTVYDPDDPADHYLRTDLPASFDYLLFVGKSTPTRPLDCR